MAALAVAALALGGFLGGCRLVDQTTFDPALRARVFAPPKPTAAAAVAPSGPPPLLTIRFDRPVAYAAQLRAAVGDALRRKPDVEFTVVTVVPDTGSVDDQIAAVRRFGADARQVAADIQGDGVDPGQVGLGARAEPGASGREVRVYVR